MIRPLSLSHILVSRIVREGDHVVDATAGNGHDTKFLATLVGEAGRVTAFDIQELALINTRKRLSESGLESRVKLYMDTHSRMGYYITEPVSAVMFNLGYLPGGDKSIVTRGEESLSGVSAALNLLAEGGIITIMAYPGHPGGLAECKMMEEFLGTLPQDMWNVGKFSSLNGARDAPFLMAVIRK